MSAGRLHNGGHSPLSVPGFNNLPIYLELHPDERFAHGSNEWALWPNLTARELAMLRVMEALTDKLDWQIKVFNDEIVTKWREEALSMPLISNSAWDWCLAELQDKAALFAETGRVVVLNSGCGICKSDTIVPPELQAELREGTRPLLALPDPEMDWHPGSEQQVLNLVHPSLYPLVYGRTRVLMDGGQVDLKEFLNSYGRGTLAPSYSEDHLDRGSVERRETSRTVTPFWTYNEFYLSRFSRRFQWLPCEVEFTGHSDTSVRVTSYINNLHPTRFKSLYSTIEKLISLAIEPWNDILIKGGPVDEIGNVIGGGRGRWPARIRTWGVEWKPEKPPEWWPSLREVHDLEKDRSSEAFRMMVHRIRDYLLIPENHPEEQTISEMAWTLSKTIPEDWEEKDSGLVEAMCAKWNRLYHWEHPEPGMAFTYQQWKAGQTSNAIIKRINRDDPEDIVEADPDHEYYSVALQDTFREQGLQIVVKLASIELTPNKPSYPGGNWHIEGMLNEHIVATAIFYYDVDNVTEARLSFRQETKMEPEEFVYERDRFKELVAVFAVPGMDPIPGPSPFGQGPSNQELGSVSTPQGRLLAWPNTLQHRVEPFRLVDESKPGHRRFIVLWLVDPHYRVCSTRNVPPQRHDWWADEAFATVGFTDRGLPQETVDMIDKCTDGWPMDMDEAKRLRRELMEERTVAEDYVMTSGSGIYNFCEH